MLQYWVFILLLILLVVICVCIESNDIFSNKCNITLEVEERTGSFDIYIDNKESWFTSKYVYVTEMGELMSTENGKLKFVNIKEIKSIDSFGEYMKLEIQYVTIFGTPVFFSIYQYECSRFIFEQYFKNGMKGTSIGNADGISTSFPSFELPNRDDLGYAQWVSWFYGDSSSSSGGNSNHRNNRNVNTNQHRKALIAPGFQTPLYGLWNRNHSFSNNNNNNNNNNNGIVGGIGGSGVICVFDKDAKISAVLSPFTNPMISSHVSNRPGILQYGIMGNISDIPENFSMKTYLQIGSGINSVMEEWGYHMRKYYSKSNSTMARKKDLTLQYLGFTTDNGAYYYYYTLPNQTYEDTLIAVKNYADKVGIPYRYVLLDSWWYYKGDSGGVTNWAAKPDIFPHGLEYLFHATSWFVQAHNRYWDQDAVYATKNGGNYHFIIDSVNHGSVPNDDRFWIDLFSKTNDWGLTVYEQDWLFNEFYEYVSQMLESTDLSKRWLTQMAEGAKLNNITIQYCMPYIRHLLQSLEFDVVTQARASDDYVVSPYDGIDNWRIGGQTILLEALGLASSKDGFWTSKYQRDNPYGTDRYEPYPRLQSVVATLSSGPIAIGDGIDFSDVDLIMSSCSKSGRLLQPSNPARLIDDAILYHVFENETQPNGEIWFASTKIDNFLIGYVFVADLKNSWSVYPSRLGMSKYVNYWAYDHEDLQLLSSHHPLILKSCGIEDFHLWTIVPILDNGWAFLGEMNKWVRISETRFSHIQTTHDGISVVAWGSESELLRVAFIDPQGKIIQVECYVGVENQLVISSTGFCTSSK